MFIPDTQHFVFEEGLVDWCGVVTDFRCKPQAQMEFHSSRLKLHKHELQILVVQWLLLTA